MNKGLGSQHFCVISVTATSNFIFWNECNSEPKDDIVMNIGLLKYKQRII